MTATRECTALPPRLAHAARDRRGLLGRAMHGVWSSYVVLSVPFPAVFIRLPRAARETRFAAWELLKRALYSDRLFRPYCTSPGKRLRLVGSPPLATGNPARVIRSLRGGGRDPVGPGNIEEEG